MKRPSLYELLPRLYRRRDLEVAAESTAAPPLATLFSILQSQFDALQDEIGTLYDDLFVETCDSDALLRLGEPFGISNLATSVRGADIRSLVANIVSYRQRKGTAEAFNGFASDLTGWTVRLEDGVRTQATNARLDSTATPHIGFARLKRAALASAPRSLDVGEARHGIAVANIAVWRAPSLMVTNAEPFMRSVDGRRRTFNPAGADVMMMRYAAAGEPGAGSRATMPLTREDARTLLAGGQDLGFAVRDAAGPLTPQIEDLSNWDDAAVLPATSLTLSVFSRILQTFGLTLDGDETRIVLVDPELGRLVVNNARPLFVDYMPTTLDGIGAVPRSHPWSDDADRTLVVYTSPPDQASTEYETFFSLQGALARAAAIDPSEARSVRIVLADSGTFHGGLKGWTYAPPVGRRTLSIETAPGVRPTIIGTLHLAPEDRCTIKLRGLLIRGSVFAGANAAVEIERATLRADDPTQNALTAEASRQEEVPITVRTSMVDKIVMNDNRPLRISDSIVIYEVRGTAALQAQRVTFLRDVRVAELTAEDCVFNGGVRSSATHTGFARYCLLPPTSVTPVRYACVETDRQMLASLVAGRPRFARLHEGLPASVRSGGSEGWEIGAFAHYAENARLENLRRAIEEFLPDTVSACVEFRS
jgi:hypothetical protein